MDDGRLKKSRDCVKREGRKLLVCIIKDLVEKVMWLIC